MEQSGLHRLGLTRLRWRLRGAWQWPAFALFIAGDALLLHELPISGDSQSVAAAVLLAAFFNLVAVGVAGPLGGALLRRRRGMPRVVARDYAGTVAIVAVAALLALLGVLHHPSVAADRRAFQAQAEAVRLYVRLHAAAEFRARLGAVDTFRLDARLYRTCVAGRAPGRRLCLIVDAARAPPTVRVDPSSASNSSYHVP